MVTHRYVAVDSIVTPPDRIRREFPEEANQELQSSIQRPAGLLHAIVLELVGEEYHLRAGERRLVAIKDIYDLGGSFTYDGSPVPPGLVPYTLLTDLSPLERLEVEVDENDRRLNPSWQERALATAKLAELRRLQATARGTPPPTTATLTAERGMKYQGTVRNELILARHLDDPDVARAKSPEEGIKVLIRKEQDRQNQVRAETVGVTLTSASHTLLNEDSLAWMKAADPDQFDVLLTDPIYGMGADEFGDSGKSIAGSHAYNDTYEEWCRHMDVLCPESFRLTKPEAHAYLFCDIDRFHELRDRMTAVGWKVFRTPLIWNNPSKYRAPWPERGPQRKYECILYAIKGDRRVNKLFPDVVTFLADENLGHAAQKPIDLFVNLLSRSVQAGDRVFDPFCGSGPIFPAAHELKVFATGIERETGAFGIAVKRIQGLNTAQGDLLHA
jgi:DNA modification methylase